MGDDLLAVDLPFYSATIWPWGSIYPASVQAGCVATRTKAVVFKGGRQLRKCAM
jgi:hypothetical protein